MKAQMRNVQPNPTSGIKWVTIIGKITPPSDEPAATRPMAAPLFFRNHVDTCAIISHGETEPGERTYAGERWIEHH